MLIAVGAHRSRDLSIPGVDLDGVYKGIEFLLNVNLGYKFTIGKKVVVIGGGNVAMDVARSAAREVVRQHEFPMRDPESRKHGAVASHEMVDISLSALRMGASEVHIVCIERRDEIPAALEEVEEAETEGVTIHAGSDRTAWSARTAKSSRWKPCAPVGCSTRMEDSIPVRATTANTGGM